MKKWISIVGVCVVLFGMATAVFMAIRNNNQEKQMESTNQDANNGKILVAYFSRPGENYNVGNVEVGNTELLAKEIIARTGADEFKITPVEAYPDSYQETIDQATNERNDNARPEYSGRVDNFNDYDTIFIGYPIWWGDMPMIVYKFLEDYDFAGKTVIPFNTHEGSGG